MFDGLLTDYDAMRAEMQKRQEELATTLRPKFQEAFVPIFERHPSLEAITFTAYTPHFNDGEECIYSVNEPYMEAFDFSEIESYDAKRISAAKHFVLTGEVDPDTRETYDKWAKDRYESAEAYLRSGSQGYIDLGPEKLAELGAITDEYPTVEAIIRAVPEEVMRGMFGDHMKVIITADGVEAEEYDHD